MCGCHSYVHSLFHSLLLKPFLQRSVALMYPCMCLDDGYCDTTSYLSKLNTGVSYLEPKIVMVLAIRAAVSE